MSAGRKAEMRGAREWHGETQREKNQEEGFWEKESFGAQSLRSQTSSVINSRGFRQMLTAAAYMIETKIYEADLTDVEVQNMGWECLLEQNACGGGLKTDIMSLVCAMLQGVEAEPQDMVEVIVYWYFLLLSEDLPLCALTWRPLAVTALLTAIKGTLPDQSSKLHAHILCTISHWFPTGKVNRALEKFSARSQSSPTLFSASVYAKVFFSLRDVALRCDDHSTSSLNAEHASTNDPSGTALHKDSGWAAFRNRAAASDHTFSVSGSSSFHDDSSDLSLNTLRRRSQPRNPQGAAHASVHGGNRPAPPRPVEPASAPTAAPASSCKISL